MRAPGFGAPKPALYAAAIDMCAWAENHGCIAAVICEHHASEDGYLPSPLILASAIAARTERLFLNLVVILPFYDPVRLAEDLSVLDIISNGRVSVVFGIGYRPEEYEHFGVDIRHRGRLADHKLDLLRRLLSDELVVQDGRRIAVTPRPHTEGGPILMWGGASLAAARRAGRNGLGLLANGGGPGMKEAYDAASLASGHQPGPALIPDRDTASVVFVADDVDRAWDEIGPYLLHDARMYAQWNPGNETSAGLSDVGDVHELRETSKSHVILSVPEAVERVCAGAMLNLSPLCGGLPPDLAWPYLERVGGDVMQHAAAGAPTGAGDGLEEALNDLLRSN